MNKRIFIFLFLVLMPYFTFGQEELIDFPAMRWTTAHGLDHPRVHDVAVDSRGVIWVGTWEGLHRHHGDKFENMNTIIDNSPFDNKVEAYDLYIDNEDRLWIGTIENGLMMYDIKKKTFRHFKAIIDGKDRLSNLRIYGLHTLNDSIFRFTSHTHGLIDYNINQDIFKLKEVFTDEKALKEQNGFQRMLCPLETANSIKIENWYHCLTGMIKYDVQLDSFMYFDNGGPIYIRDAVIDKDSLVWCVTYGQGLFSFDLNSKEFVNYPCTDGYDSDHPCLPGACVQIYNDSMLIIDTNDRLYYFNKNSLSFHRFENMLPYSDWSGRTTNMKWINGELWQASSSSTLYRHFLDDHGVQSVSTSKNVDEIYYDELNQRYISTTFSGLITIYKDNEYQEIRIPDSFLKDNARIKNDLEGVVVDHSGKLWVAINNKVLLYNARNNTFSSPLEDVFAPINGEITITKIALHPNGSIWLSSRDGSVITFDPISYKHKIYGRSSMGSYPLEYRYRARFKQFSNDGYVWFQAQDGFFGISPDDKNHKFCKDLIHRKNNQPVNIISPEFAIDKNGKICFGAQTHELYIVDKDSIDGGFVDLIDLKDIVPNQSISDIKIDDSGIIWVATKMGLIQINRKTNDVQLYGDTHRLYDLEELHLKEGKYPIATSHNDFLIVNPDELTPFPGTPNIQILDIELDSKPIKNKNGNSIQVGEEIDLMPKDNYLRIQFNDFNYVSQKPKTYAIKIESLHDDWIDLKEKNDFGFSGLPGGLTDVWIKSKLQFAKEYSEPVKLLSINVTPPLTQRKSFWAFCAGLLLLLFYLAYRYRLAQLNEKQNLMIAFNKQLAETEMKALRAQMNPHFLFNVLNAIKLNVQKNEQENAIDFITDFSKLIRSVLQNSGKQRISLEEELNTLGLYVKIERKRFSTSFDYEFIVDEGIDLKNITIPPMLLQPYVENAIWHGILHKSEGKGKIKVTAAQVNETVIVEIIDNGIGREKANQLKLKSAQRNKSMGMQITQDRMAMSNSISSDHIEVNIVDLYDDEGTACGTKVELRLQLNL